MACLDINTPETETTPSPTQIIEQMNSDTPHQEGYDQTEIETEAKPLSKNQQKKLKKREKWLQLKAVKRAGEKNKRKRKYAEAREKGVTLGPTRKSLKRTGMKDSQCKVRVVIDCSFDNMMTYKDIIHLTQQIQHSYAANRRAQNALQFYVSGINGKLKKRLEGIGDYKGWDIFMKEEGFMSLFDQENIIYLSSESPNILSTIEDDKVYIIGGLVDHNHHKGFCHNLAEEKGLQHAQLPIGEYIDMKARKVLTINHVFEILLRYTESQSWEKAFFSVLPQRKGAMVKNSQVSEQSVIDKDEDTNESLSVSDNAKETISDISQHPDAKNENDNICEPDPKEDIHT
ncbi:hypothetical protein SNE40_018530 [Patella caerulea]|uniref:tRNA (guanine(9)-N(1))-methyltransferase n=1 Tax=Patella caerulea TaxID=87958 RepID=A0AAN8J7I1_PATCE